MLFLFNKRYFGDTNQWGQCVHVYVKCNDVISVPVSERDECRCAIHSFQGKAIFVVVAKAKKKVCSRTTPMLCVNNQGLTYGVKPCNWSDASKGRLAPSAGCTMPHGASDPNLEKGLEGGQYGCLWVGSRTHIQKKKMEVMECPDWMTPSECPSWYTSAALFPTIKGKLKPQMNEMNMWPFHITIQDKVPLHAVLAEWGWWWG